MQPYQAILSQYPQLRGYREVQRVRHGLHVQRPDGQFEAYFTGAPLFYEATPGRMKPIDTDLVDVGDGYRPTGLDIHIHKNGRLSLPGGVFFQDRFLGWLRDDPFSFDSLWPITATPNVDRHQLSGHASTHSLSREITTRGLRDTIILPALPPGSGTGFGLKTLCGGITWPDGPVNDEIYHADWIIGMAQAWDALGADLPVARMVLTEYNQTWLYTYIPHAALQQAQYPITIDPDLIRASDAADGTVSGSSTSYATARGTAAAQATTSNTNSIGQEYQTGITYKVYRGFLLFNTSSIPDNDIINKVNLYLSIYSNTSTEDFVIELVKQNWSAQNPLDAANRDTAYDNCLSGTKDVDFFNTSTLGTLPQTITSPNLDTSWISKTDNTYYSMRSSRDYSGTPPADNRSEYIKFYSGDDATYYPYLVVQYSTPSVVLPVSLKPFKPLLMR